MEDNLSIREVSLDVFEELMASEKLIDYRRGKPRTDRAWVLSILDRNYGFAFDSSLVVFVPKMHILSPPDSDVCIVGVHDRVFAVDRTSGKLLLLLGVRDPITSLEALYYGFLIITDSTVVGISNSDMAITHLSILPGYILNYELNETQLIVNCEGEKFSINV